MTDVRLAALTSEVLLQPAVAPTRLASQQVEVLLKPDDSIVRSRLASLEVQVLVASLTGPTIKALTDISLVDAELVGSSSEFAGWFDGTNVQPLS